ncbi:CPBP family intramembrane metalloprotease [Mucilaginibacter sp. BJC16-A38]|uniref:CPBP family intramembrane glutamic endopeptidase n=1 Tax=Mucilaginibacter phenanthrenivorans TaxID=1234842 RepID=UPI0021584B74|nr:CPBP family intramembrane glutamic endopeptidase [Mucilaginibacter phenanthrenivorans]MCR8558983.1 CPBP family intramembrane metalloprotease [Mucilaginibacter phenanthrenivorans]
MLQPLASTYFTRQPEFRFKLSSVLIFIPLAAVAWGINILGQVTFSSQNLIPYLVRITVTLTADLALIYVSSRLLKQNGLPGKALGLSTTKETIPGILGGALIGTVVMFCIAGLLFIYAPYHFVPGQIGAGRVLQESVSYLSGNTLEELMFRGFLFIICCQLADWRKAALIMALPFGLFHLQGIGINLYGLKMVTTTACYSLVFCLSFVLFRSMWAAISVHVISNILLHTITGLDGANRALLKPVPDKNWTGTYDVGLWIAVLSTLFISGILFLLILFFNKRYKLKN